MASKHALAFALAVVLEVTASGARAAEPTAEEKETARAMMDEGHARRDAGEHEGALAQFQGADAIMHVPTTGLEVAREQSSLGRLVEARDILQRILRTAATDDEPEAFRAARANAAALDDELVRRIPALKISVEGAPSDASLQVSVDAVRVPVPALVAPFRVNPGHHVVTAVAGDTTAREELDVADGQTAPVALALTDSRAALAVHQDASEASTQARGTPALVPWLQWGGLGLAAAGIGVGSITGAMSISTTNATSKQCVQDRCGPRTWSDIDSARTLATVSTISFVAAGVGAALGITGVALGGSSPAPTHAASSARGQVVPWVDVRSVGVSGTF